MAPSVIETDLLIPGRGDPIKDAALAWENDRIVWLRAATKVEKVPVITPGLWDCHVHFLGTTSYQTEDIWREPRALCSARGARDVAELLNAGYTSVRELGGDGHELAKAINEGYLAGPNIYSSVSVLSPTAGHGDGHSIPLDTFKDACSHGMVFEVCDGVPECLRAVRLQLRRGAKVIKVCASGGVASEIDDPHHQEFSDDELRAMVEEAHRAQRVVAAHCHGKAGIMAALHTGVTTIEHGTYIDDEAISEMLEKKAILVPTRTIHENGLKLREHWTDKSYAKLQVVAAHQFTTYQKAIKAGARIALGSDLGCSRANTVLSHGQNGIELKYAVDAGMTPLQAIEAATAAGPETLGPPAPRAGQLKEGFDADFIALSSNPLDNIEILSQAKNVTHVWKGGKQFKSPAVAGRWLFPGLRQS
ncbi:uncharacterized protein Z518_00126 [Rhinocladiella mackenziei CBS 650.93]|uniref:Amidohydrolase-related domain-containing protein n=1 Tax=Rhinocladiella mackenziei CBS 650.93 TaxID=1442369 RepID=A0A0D2HEM5_9EURO|nr:uncharacterized protein Z518_00126 [Rhinocladiella mackenziei CBS 650.93]KIX09048.1 hypothetical protein Z518_00126 [Rhinocladiella mackenziei CBS 650.93]